MTRASARSGSEPEGGALLGEARAQCRPVVPGKPSFQAEVLVPAEQTDHAFTLLLTQNEPPGFGPPLHRHRDSAEAFFVLEGEYLMFLEDEQRSCPADPELLDQIAERNHMEVLGPVPETYL